MRATVANIFFYNLVSLDRSTKNCILPAYPYLVPAAVNYMDSLGAVVACGGLDYDAGDIVSECFSFDGSNWTPLPDSIHKHEAFSSSNLITDKGWWLAGPLADYDYYISYDEWTSEIFTGEEWIEGPQHPANYSAFSCIASVNSTHSLLTGGAPANYDQIEGDPTLTTSWLFDWTAGVWTETGNLNERRALHGCALLEGQGVLVAGGVNGRDSGDSIYSVELYDPESGTWSLQPGLPQDTDPSSIVLLRWNKTVVALLYDQTEVYQRREDGTWTALQGVGLDEEFEGSYNKAAMVPDDFAPGCN